MPHNWLLFDEANEKAKQPLGSGASSVGIHNLSMLNLHHFNSALHLQVHGIKVDDPKRRQLLKQAKVASEWEVKAATPQLPCPVTRGRLLDLWGKGSASPPPPPPPPPTSRTRGMPRHASVVVGSFRLSATLQRHWVAVGRFNRLWRLQPTSLSSCTIHAPLGSPPSICWTGIWSSPSATSWRG